jgi:hypothetical protein
MLYVGLSDAHHTIDDDLPEWAPAAQQLAAAPWLSLQRQPVSHVNVDTGMVLKTEQRMTRQQIWKQSLGPFGSLRCLGGCDATAQCDWARSRSLMIGTTIKEALLRAQSNHCHNPSVCPPAGLAPLLSGGMTCAQRPGPVPAPQEATCHRVVIPACQPQNDDWPPVALRAPKSVCMIERLSYTVLILDGHRTAGHSLMQVIAPVRHQNGTATMSGGLAANLNNAYHCRPFTRHRMPNNMAWGQCTQAVSCKPTWQAS